MAALPLRALTLRQLQFFSVLVAGGPVRPRRAPARDHPAGPEQCHQADGKAARRRAADPLHPPARAHAGGRRSAGAHRFPGQCRRSGAARHRKHGAARSRLRAHRRDPVGQRAASPRRWATSCATRGATVELAWRDAPSTTLLAEVRSGQLDMAVAAITEPPGGLACVDLFRDPLVLVVRRDHALAQAGEANWEAIGSERLVLFESGSMPALGIPARAQFAQGSRALPGQLLGNALRAGARRARARADAAALHLVAARSRARGAAAREAARRAARGAGLPAGADAQRGGAGADRLLAPPPAAAAPARKRALAQCSSAAAWIVSRTRG